MYKIVVHCTNTSTVHVFSCQNVFHCTTWEKKNNMYKSTIITILTSDRDLDS